MLSKPMGAVSLLVFASTCWAQPSLSLVTPPTQTTAVFGIRGYSGSCRLMLSESPSGSPLQPDVNGAEYSGANMDTSRPDTYYWSDHTRIVQLGHNTGDRALAAATTYRLQVSGCGGTASLTFTTPTVSSGSNQQWPAPFDATHPWNFGYPLVNLLHRQSVVDPLTGVKLTPINLATDWTWRTGIQPYYGATCCAGAATPFSYWSGGSGWTNPADISNGNPSGSASRAGTTNTNPLDLYGLYTRFLGGNAGDPWGGITYDDLGVALWGSASNQMGANNQLTLCLFTNPKAGCLGRPVSVTLPPRFGHVASSSPDADKSWPASFPSPFFKGWGLDAPLGPDYVNTSGELSASDGVLSVVGANRFHHFPSTMTPGQKIYVAGSSPTCANNLCTIKSYENYSKITIAENLTIHNAAFTTLMWGVRIQKKTATGSITIGAAFKQAGSRALDQADAGPPTCNVHGFTTGDGHFGYICKIESTAYSGGAVLYFVSSDGTIRGLYSGVVPLLPTCFSPSDPNDRPRTSQFVAGGFVPDGRDAKTWYVYLGNGGGSSSLYKLVYGGNATESMDFDYGLDQSSDGFIHNPPCDQWTWTNILPRGSDLQTQIKAKFPKYDSALYGSWTDRALFDGVTGHYAYFDNVYSGQDGGPAWIAQLDVSKTPAMVTNLIHTADGTGTDGRVAWGAHHNTGPSSAVPNLVGLAENRLNGNDSSKLHGGPFEATVIGIRFHGVWNANTVLPWPIDASYDNACPAGNSYGFMGATGNQCVTLRIPQGGVCNIAPTAAEKAKWPCPWNSKYAQPFPLKVGNVFSDASQQADAEKFRIVKIERNNDGGLTVIAQRNAMWDYCCVGATHDGVNHCVGSPADNRHSNHWTIMMYPPALNGCASGGFVISSDTGLIQEPGRTLGGGHGDIVPGIAPGNAGYIGIDYLGNIGSKADSPIRNLFTLPTIYDTLKSPSFGGRSLAPGGGAVQAYPISPGGVPWLLDANTMNGNLGLGPELAYNTIGSRRIQSAGTANVYLIQVIGKVDYKVFPLIGWAGRYLLRDVSGPASTVDSTPWSLCYAFTRNECHHGSTAGQVYVNVPGASDTGSCPTGQSWALVPCVISGFPGGGGFRQARFDKPDTTSRSSRLLTYLLTSPGEHYPYSAFVGLPDGKAAIGSPHELQNWGPVAFLVKLPPWETDGIDRTNAVSIPVTIPPGQQKYAELQFGYARYGMPGKFYCTARTEACNTSSPKGQPFNFESEPRRLTPCAEGCTILLPVVAPNLVYYRIRRSNDGIHWTNQDIIPRSVATILHDYLGPGLHVTSSNS